MAEFKNILSYEIWDSVFECDDINKIFNSSFNTCLRIFYSSFPLITINKAKHNNSWITMDIKTSGKQKGNFM
jgi:hypothetical protein